MDVGHEVIVLSDDDSATIRETEAARQRAAWRATHEADAAWRAANKKRASKKKKAAKELAAEMKKAAKKRVAAREAIAVAIRGLNKKGNAKFDEYCVFANRVAMNHSQVKCLGEVAKKRPEIPAYVCTIKGAHIDDERAKMYFTQKFRKSYIQKYLGLPAVIDVFKKINKRIGEVRVIFGKGKGTGVQITSNWKDVVESTNMREGQVFMFCFRKCVKKGLVLVIKEVK